MATIVTITQSKFLGCPIIVTVTPGSVSAKATFHRIRLKVKVTGDGHSRDFEFSKPVSGSSALDINVSSAFVAMADMHEYTANVPNSYPSYTASLQAYDDYLLDGVEQSSSPSGGSVGTVYIGTLSDRERQTGARPDRWTRKPTSSPEIVFSGHVIVVPGSGAGAPSASQPSASTGMNTTYNTYGITMPPDGYEMRFINSLGVHESVHVACLPAEEETVHTDRYVKSRQETLTKISRGVTRKQNDHERWKMSSGPLDLKWQRWYRHEFLMARWAWIKVDSQWLQVHILPEDTVPGADRASGKPLTVAFTIEFDITGSPFA